MSRCTLVFLALTLCCFTSNASAGFAYLAVGNQSGGCDLENDTGLITIAVIHQTSNQDAKGIRYLLSTCTSTLQWLTDVNYFPNTTGRSIDGIEVLYSGCIGSGEFIHVQNVLFMGDGTSPVDSGLKMFTHPGWVWPAQEGIQEIRCDDSTPVESGDGICIKPVTCYCNVLATPSNNIACGPVPVESQTWGRVKALYE